MAPSQHCIECRISNLSSEALTVKRNKHFWEAILTFKPNDKINSAYSTHVQPIHTAPTAKNHSSSIDLDPGILPRKMWEEFHAVLKEYDTVFEPHFKRYNGAAGSFHAKVHTGPIEPSQRKGLLPQYNSGKLVELQEKFNRLEEHSIHKILE